MNEIDNTDPGAEVIVEADVELALALAPRDVGVSVAVGAVLEITVSALTRNPLAHLTVIPLTTGTFRKPYACSFQKSTKQLFF